MQGSDCATLWLSVRFALILQKLKENLPTHINQHLIPAPAHVSASRTCIVHWTMLLLVALQSSDVRRRTVWSTAEWASTWDWIMLIVRVLDRPTWIQKDQRNSIRQFSRWGGRRPEFESSPRSQKFRPNSTFWTDRVEKNLHLRYSDVDEQGYRRAGFWRVKVKKWIPFQSLS